MSFIANKMIISWRSFALSLVFAIVAALSSAAEPIDRIIESAVGWAAWRPVSGEIVMVGLDDRTLGSVPDGRFTRADHARVIEAVNNAGARRLMVDFYYQRQEGSEGTSQLAAAVQKMGNRIILAVSTKTVPGTDRLISIFPDPAISGPNAQLASIAWNYQIWQVWNLPLMFDVNGRLLPSVAAALANKRGDRATEFRLDLTYDLSTITEYSALDVLEGKVGPRELAGKDVIFGATASTLPDQHYLPGHDLVPGAFIHLIGAEALKRGNPVNVGWLPAMLISAGGLLFALLTPLERRFTWIALGMAAALVAAKVMLMGSLVTSSVGVGLFLISAVSANVSRNRRRFSAQRENPVSGLPNFEALRGQAPFGSATVIAAKLVNFEDLAAFLPGEGSQQLVDQVARRLTLACHGTQLHHDLDGTFAWLVPYYQHSQIEEHLAGLAALFNAPLTIGELKIDVAIAFGVNDEFEGSNAQRLAAALVAAEKSIRTRALWTKYMPRQKEDAGWQLSFHSQLEDALAGGDIWVAFQPQYEIATRRLVGVEALARWTHPTRGPIPPDEFIVQAEKSQDIYRLTLFVMDQAIRSSAHLRSRGLPVNMSVNLSATLLDHSDLVGTIRVMLTAHHLPPEALTIEITETAQIENSRQARQTLAQLRRTGIRLSIDDYGTGQSNLEYLTEIEADEIKIDKRFVMTMRDSQRNFEVVKSTIDLAHRLGAVAVAEGIEDAPTMALLEQLGCDVGQGYHLGKPQIFSELAASLLASPHSRSA